MGKQRSVALDVRIEIVPGGMTGRHRLGGPHWHSMPLCPLRVIAALLDRSDYRPRRIPTPAERSHAPGGLQHVAYPLPSPSRRDPRQRNSRHQSWSGKQVRHAETPNQLLAAALADGPLDPLLAALSAGHLVRSVAPKPCHTRGRHGRHSMAGVHSSSDSGSGRSGGDEGPARRGGAR